MQEHGPARSAITVSPAPLVEDGSASLGDGGLRLAAGAVVLSTAVAQVRRAWFGLDSTPRSAGGVPFGPRRSWPDKGKLSGHDDSLVEWTNHRGAGHDHRMVWTRSNVETLALPIDALALLILHDYKSAGGWNWQNWMRGSEQQGTASDQGVSAALAEGWGWLMSHGLVVRDPSQQSPDAYRVTRLGDETLRYGVAKLAAAERLGVALHPRIAQRVEQQYLLGEFELAVLAAMKDVEVRVRELAGAPDSLLGVKLMQQAFSSTAAGPLTDPEADPGEQVAAMDLFKGAIGLFKNPVSHRPVNYDDPTVASEIILLADLLLRLLDQIAHRLRQ